MPRIIILLTPKINDLWSTRRNQYKIFLFRGVEEQIHFYKLDAIDDSILRIFAKSISFFYCKLKHWPKSCIQTGWWLLQIDRFATETESKNVSTLLVGIYCFFGSSSHFQQELDWFFLLNVHLRLDHLERLIVQLWPQVYDVNIRHYWFFVYLWALITFFHRQPKIQIQISFVFHLLSERPISTVEITWHRKFT